MCKWDDFKLFYDQFKLIERYFCPKQEMCLCFAKCGSVFVCNVYFVILKVYEVGEQLNSCSIKNSVVFQEPRIDA